ncbi:hypothetical protein EDD85DRAFT_869585 [Armillaria nabsnona]|nr:hypothetical protein EDD85DRAFT_869585 [Armillaria nabsnona]
MTASILAHLSTARFPSCSHGMNYPRFVKQSILTIFNIQDATTALTMANVLNNICPETMANWCDKVTTWPWKIFCSTEHIPTFTPPARRVLAPLPVNAIRSHSQVFKYAHLHRSSFQRPIQSGGMTPYSEPRRVTFADPLVTNATLCPINGTKITTKRKISSRRKAAHVKYTRSKKKNPIRQTWRLTYGYEAAITALD